MNNPFEIPDTPFAAGLDEWDEIYANAKAKHPVRFFLSKTIPQTIGRWWNRFIREPWYQIRCRLWHRYNVLHVRTLPPTWVDRDDVLMHAAFQVLVDFCEQEEPAEFTNTWQEHFDLYKDCGEEHARERANDAQELKDLYRWWTVERGQRPEYVGHLSSNLKEWTEADLQKASDIEKQQHAEDEAMLIRLMKIRRHLWT